MNEHDAASDWATQNPNDPRSQDILAKSWAMKNQHDPRSAQILNKLKGQYSGDPKAVDGTATQPAPGVNPFDTATVQSVNQKEVFAHDPELAKFKATIDQATGPGPEGIAKVASNYLLPMSAGPLANAAGSLGRIGIGAMMGAAQNPDNMTGGAVAGGMLGTGLEGLKGLLSGVSRAGGVSKMAMGLSHGSPDLQDQAIDKIQQTSQALRNSPINDVKNDLLSKANVQISPTEYLGKTPEVDQMIRNAIASKSQYGMIPDKLTLSGSELNQIRQSLDSNIPWKSMPYNSLQAQDIQKGQDLQALANKTRDALHSISPELDDAMTQVSSNLKGASYLDKKGPSALGTLSSQNPDKMATLNSLGEDAGTDLGDYANQMRSAKKMAKSPLTSGPAQLVKQGIKGASKGLSDASGVNSPTTLSGILSMLK